MIQTVAACCLVAHGLVHLLWFVLPWRLMEVDGLPDTTAVTFIASPLQQR